MDGEWCTGCDIALMIKCDDEYTVEKYVFGN